jgi:ABC-type Na+ efflux pump permease subunit
VIKRLALIGAGIGLLICVTILLFLWLYGIFEWKIGGPHGLDLTRLLWPSSIMLTAGWRHTVRGALIAFILVAINCLIYAAVAAGIGIIVESIRPSQQN